MGNNVEDSQKGKQKLKRSLENNSVNLFGVIRDVSSRIEPYHSHFLAMILAYEANQTFRLEFIKKCVPDNIISEYDLLNITCEEIAIIPERTINDGEKIDILINFKNKNFKLGIEIKTSDSSTSQGQLMSYRNGLHKEYEGHTIFMAYITPFNSENPPKKDINIHAVNEYKSFIGSYPDECIHLNWDQIVDLYSHVDSNNNHQLSLLDQHREYIKREITNKDKYLKKLDNNRALSIFLGEVTVKKFYSFLTEYDFIDSINYDSDDIANYTIFDLDTYIGHYHVLVEALTVLLNSEQLKVKERKKQTADEEMEKLKAAYEKGLHGEFFKNLFDVIFTKKYIWLKGTNDIGVRALHKEGLGGPNGVSIFTITKNSVLLTNKR